MKRLIVAFSGLVFGCVLPRLHAKVSNTEHIHVPHWPV